MGVLATGDLAAVVVEDRDQGTARINVRVVLPLKRRPGPELEVRVTATQDPQDPAGLGVDLVHGRGVAHRHQEAAIAQRLDRVDVVGVPGEAVGRDGHLDVAQGNVVAGVPGPKQLPGAQVVLLNRGVDHRPVVGTPVLGQVHGDVAVGGDPGVVAVDHELVHGERPPALALQSGDRPVVLVGHHVRRVDRSAVVCATAGVLVEELHEPQVDA